MIDGIFLTGTGTGVGKSGAAAFAVAAARSVGLAPLYWKPVQCGPGEWKGVAEPDGDVGTVRKLAGGKFPSFASLTYTTPASPHRAASLESGELDLDSILIDWGLLQEGALPEGVSGGKFNWVVIEGAGGLLVPLTDREDMAWLARETVGKTVLVSLPGLGAINQTRMAVEAARSRGLKVEGFLFSPPDREEDPELIEDNWKVISRTEGVPFLGFVPRLVPGGVPFVEKHHPLAEWLRGVASELRETV